MQYTERATCSFPFYGVRITEYELCNRDYTNQTKFPFGPDTMTRRYAAIAFPLTVYLSDHRFRNTSLTTLLYSRSSHTYTRSIYGSHV